MKTSYVELRRRRRPQTGVDYARWSEMLQTWMVTDVNRRRYGLVLNVRG